MSAPKPDDDLREMLRAAKPEILHLSDDDVTTLVKSWRFSVSFEGWNRILTWADERRDAAVAKATDGITALMADLIERKDAEIVCLRKALEPFARADRAIGDEPGPFRLETARGYREFDRDDLRNARAALERKDEGDA